MDTDGGLLRLALVNGVFGAAAFLFDSEDAKRSNGFERIIRLGMEKPEPKIGEVRGIDQKSGQEKRK